MYRTIDTSGNTLETWDTREQVFPTIDYHKIQLVTPITFAIQEEYNSLYDMNDQLFYTVDKDNNRIETFGSRAHEVQPREDYHKIILEVYGVPVASWDSMYELHNLHR